MSNEVSKYVWDAYGGVDTRELEKELAKESPEWPGEKSIMWGDFPLKKEGWPEVFTTPEYEVLFQDKGQNGDYQRDVAKTWPVEGITRIANMLDDKTEWDKTFYPEEWAEWAKKYPVSNKFNKLETEEDKEWRRRTKKEYAEWLNKYSNIPISSQTRRSTGGPTSATYHELEQPDPEKIVDILDTIGPTLDSLMTEIQSMDEHGHTTDSLYSKNIRNKLMGEGVYMRGIDPFFNRDLFNSTFLIGGFYDTVEDAADTLNFNLLPDTRETLDTWFHELMHGAPGLRHTGREEHTLTYDREVDYAIQELYKKNPEGYRELEKMINMWTEGGEKGLNWILPKDIEHTELDFLKDEAKFLKGEQVGAQQEFYHNIQYIPDNLSSDERDAEIQKLQSIRDEKIMQAELKGRDLDQQNDNENKTMKLIRSWFE